MILEGHLEVIMAQKGSLPLPRSMDLKGQSFLRRHQPENKPLHLWQAVVILRHVRSTCLSQIIIRLVTYIKDLVRYSHLFRRVTATLCQASIS